MQHLGPDEQAGVPAARAQRHAVGADAEARDAVLVCRQHADALALERVPHVGVVVVVAGKQNAARRREADGRDAAEDVVVRVLVELAVGTQVEQTARCIVRARREGVAVREEPAGASRSVSRLQHAAGRGTRTARR